MAAIVANTGANNWNTNGAWVGSVQPTAADDVTIPATATVTIPTSTTAVCRSCTVSISGALAFASTTAVLTIGDGTAGSGNVAFSNAGTITLTGIGTINFISTSATQQTITSGGQTLPNLTFSGSTGSWQLADNLTSTGAVVHTGGTYDTNGKTVSELSLSSTGAVTRVLTFGSSSITNTSVNTVLSFTGSGLTFTANTATITHTNTNSSMNIGAFDLNGLSLVQSGNSTPSITGGFTCKNYTRTGTAAKTDAVSISGNFTCTGTFTINSNSDINRVLVQSNTIGTARTITAATVVIANTVDFMDITGAGAATWTVAGTGATALGNAGGNSGITFTVAATQTHTASAGGNWSDVTKWTSRVPLPQDNVVVDSNTTGTITMDMPRSGTDITFTGFAGTFASSVNWVCYGSLIYSTGMTVTGGFSFSLAGRSTHTITSSGKQLAVGAGGLTFNTPGGTYTLNDALSVPGTINLVSGTFTANNFNVTGGVYSMSLTTLNMGTGQWSITSTASGTIWNFSGTTVNASTSTIAITTASTNTRTFAGGGKTYGTLTYTVDNSPGSLTVTGANTFAAINSDAGHIITLPSATTTTIASGGTFNVNGAVNGYIYMPGVIGNYISTPDSSALSILGDITLDVKVALDDWTPSAEQWIVGKYDSATNNISYALTVLATGILRLRWSTTGSSLTNFADSTAATGLTDGNAKWLRASLDVNNGAAGNSVRFYTSDDGSAWSQLGSTVTQAGTSSIFDGSSVLEIGSVNVGTGNFLIGKVYNVLVYNSDLQSSSGTPVFNADLTAKTVGANTFTESSVNAATVTINGTLARAGDGRVSLVSSTGGSAATLSKSGSLVSVDYLSIQDSTATGGASWFAGSHSVNVSGNTGWIFAPPGGGGMLLLGVG